MITDSNFWKILKNSAQCKLCLSIIESRHRHDYVACSCGAIFIDGGTDYCRSGGDRKDFTDLSVYVKYTLDDLKAYKKRQEYYQNDSDLEYYTNQIESAKHYALAWYGETI